MTETNLEIVNIKNQWLRSHVDVAYPTPESLKGCACYFSRLQTLSCARFSPEKHHELMDGLTIYPVDFHRLTILFALLQAQSFADEDTQQLVVEFLTQIIYSPPCHLYLGLVHGKPVLAGIVTQVSTDMLISDLAVETETFGLTRQQAANALYHFLHVDELAADVTVYIEA